MSSAMPYLRSLRKSDLTTLAEISDLKDYGDLRKAELETALDEHLRANSASFSGDKRFSEYYRRLSQPGRVSSPVKKEPKTEATASGDEAKRPTRRRQTKAEIDATDDSDTADKTPASTAVAPTRTPGRSPLSLASSLPPSPAIVTDAIDRQTTIVRKSLSDAWKTSGMSERSDALRAALSSVKSIETVIIALEGLGLLRELVPLRFLTTVPAVDALRTPEFGIKVPDLFVLLSGSFWAPSSLWALTSLALPLTFAYFFNLSYRAQTSHTYGTRRSTSSAAAAATFDPLVFNIAKALIAYLVYANNFTFWDIYSPLSVERVNVAVPGQWPGLVTGAAIGVVTSLYEAVLKK
ncbi:hypothetical protein VTN77DRAFT_6980 [Rasamsonia byssochlamydoides]|uniref:uncharacterized protein n=1 Tax=Rasamsonia byssochlamydoides TaxID=89139 RepID=UPI003742D989